MRGTKTIFAGNVRSMKYLILALCLVIAIAGSAQNFQMHYDFRHSVDPDLNAANFPSFSFEYFKQIDTVGTGSFLFKLQADLKGKKNNPGQVFMQVSQSLRFWRPKIYLSLAYSGGLGVTTDSFGFYLTNSYGVGIAYPFQWKGAWLATNLLVRYNAFEKPSFDPQFTFYFGRGFLNYKIFTAGSFVFWTENRDQGNEFTAGEPGKSLHSSATLRSGLRLRETYQSDRVSIFFTTC